MLALGTAALTGFSGRGVCDVVYMGLALMCLARVGAVREQRAGWLLIGLGMLSAGLSEVYYNAVFWSVANPPVPSLQDALALPFEPLCVAGVLLLVRERARGLPRVMWADGLTTALSVGAVSALLVFQQVARHQSGSALTVGTTLAYPLTDTVLIAAVCGALAWIGWRADAVWMLLAGGFGVFWLADSLFEMHVAAGTYHPASWYDTGWYWAFYLLALAAWARPSPHLDRRIETGARSVVIPLGFGGVGLVVLVLGCIQPVTWLAVALAASSLVAVMVRVMLMFGENVATLRRSRGEALSDQLTGLGNRRALIRRLEELLEGGGRLQLALFDLDGFKTYNDRFGHPAGDALLTRVGAALRDRVEEWGEAFRLGGDEFCALIPGASDGCPLQAEQLADALSETGDGFEVTCSFGTVTLPDQAASASDALRVAAAQLYARKRDARGSPGSQAREVLIRALAEADCELPEHAERVAELAVLTARRLGLSDAMVRDVHHAAELHEIGILATANAAAQPTCHELVSVPERSYAAIGARIAAAAAALAPLAAIIRHIHEHFDGTGYPDRLAGDQIPLPARIVAVADAFDELTGPAPHGQALTAARAVAELGRAAGTRFDPSVVDALVAAQALGRQHRA
jgi:diguanylate cyclase (GGDEF)-like protein